VIWECETKNSEILRNKLLKILSMNNNAHYSK
jgi:hypothetical protein